jgi:hypothetical protein
MFSTPTAVREMVNSGGGTKDSDSIAVAVVVDGVIGSDALPGRVGGQVWGGERTAWVDVDPGGQKY